MSAPIDVTRLCGELGAAGVPVDCVRADGSIAFSPSATDADRVRAAQVLAAHDPTPQPDERANARARLEALNGKAVWTAQDREAAIRDLIKHIL